MMQPEALQLVVYAPQNISKSSSLIEELWIILVEIAFVRVVAGGINLCLWQGIKETNDEYYRKD